MSDLKQEASEGNVLEREQDETTNNASASTVASIPISGVQKAESQKSEMTQLETEAEMNLTDLKTLRQLEFYFSDSNFRRDNFLRGKASENTEGFVPISVLLTFNRLKSLCNDVVKIADIASVSRQLIVSDDKTHIRRSEPLPERDDSRGRTIFVSNIPLEESLDTLISIFSENGALGVASVRMRRDRETKAFNGTCFVEYKSQADSEAAEKAAFESHGTEFNVISLGRFLQDQKKEREATFGGAKRDRVEMPQLETGTILFAEGISPEGVDREEIKELFSKFGEVGFVDFCRGNISGHIRMVKSDDAMNALKAYTSDVASFTLGGQSFALKILKHDEEAAYMEKVQSARAERRSRSSGNKKSRH